MKDLRIEDVFEAAVQRNSAVERAVYLDGACGEDSALRARVETLLRAHEDAGRFLEPTTEHRSRQESPGSVIDRYKLLQIIGEGGFGVVYMAEQLEPVRRKVALKIIKLGMDTKQVVARFEVERQALALMDHPNIAGVLDAGATESGRPFFVMELVKGIPITEYCDQNHLSTHERLDLFLAVCHAVQHAHQKGIIHRDLKPTNVLVTLHDGRPVPKVIDFGIAKATNQRLTEKTLFTEFKQLIGTPQYMSPEQAEMSGLDVDTRADIYSLGVLLYEILTGSTPFEADRLRTAGYAEMQRILREEEPPSPSMRVSTMRDQLVAIAKHRSVDPDSLRRLIRGDLDWIVMKSLEKDRTRRYATASDLAADVIRYLSHEPVHASPPSVFYKLNKFVRRNKLAVTAGAVVLAALCLGMGLATAGLVHARREAERAGIEADRATREAGRSQAIADFLQEILASIDPGEAAQRNLEVERIAARAEELFGNDHATVAATLSSLALQLQHGGNLSDAEPLIRESLRISRNTFGDRHVQVGLTLARLGSLLRQKGDEPAAEEAFREAIDIAAMLPDESNLAFCEARLELAKILQKRGKLPESEALVREALRIRRLRPTGQEYQIANTLEQLVGILSLAGKDAEAEPVFEETLRAYEPLFARDSASYAWLQLSYGLWLRQRGKADKSEQYLREAVRIYRSLPNPPRDLYAAALDGLFQIVRTRDEAIDETIAVFNEVMVVFGHLYGRDHVLIAPHLMGFAKILEERDRAVDAIPLVIDGIRIYRKSRGEEWDAAPSLTLLERFVRRLALAPGLPPSSYEVAARGAETLAAERPDESDYRTLRGIVAYRLGRHTDAIGYLEQDFETDSELAREHRPQQLAFLALARFHAGDAPHARTTLEQARALLKEDSLAKSKFNQAAVAEAESHISKKNPPADEAPQAPVSH